MQTIEDIRQIMKNAHNNIIRSNQKDTPEWLALDDLYDAQKAMLEILEYQLKHGQRSGPSS